MADFPRHLVERVAAADLGLRPAVCQLQILGDELDVADRAFAQLDLAPLATLLAQSGFGAPLHRVHVGAHGGRVRVEQERPCPAQEIARATPANPMISYPYTRLLNANARVDMAAGLVLCSLETARSTGVPEQKLVFPLAAAEAEDSAFLSTRPELCRSRAIRLAGARALELAGRALGEIEHVDLYSCFPSAVRVAAGELGLSEERPLTVTGGLTFGGGPLNSYARHAIARTAELVRQQRGSTGLVSASGGWLAKHAIALYSAAPPNDGFRYERLPPQRALREALVDWEGPVSIEAYTVAHREGRPRIAHVACLSDDGRRSWGTAGDPELLEAMMREEFCGRRGRLDGAGGLDLA